MNAEVTAALSTARRHLSHARIILAAGVAEVAGREAYLAGYHAALAYVFAVTGKVAKTHSGLRTEFARLSRADTRLDFGFVRFLAEGYELKVLSDYGQQGIAPSAAAIDAIAAAERMLHAIEAILSPP
jgi:uncharacterized protein (UPF0332 family)